jgi:transposase
MTELVREARRAKQASERAKKALEVRDALIVQLHRAGESPKLLAEAAGLSENQIFKIVRAGRGKGGNNG